MAASHGSSLSKDIEGVKESETKKIYIPCLEVRWPSSFFHLKNLL